MNEQPTLISTPRAAKLLGVSSQTIRNWMRSGQLKSVYRLPSGQIRVTEEEVKSMLTAQTYEQA